MGPYGLIYMGKLDGLVNYLILYAFCERSRKRFGQGALFSRPGNHSTDTLMDHLIKVMLLMLL